MGADTMRWYFLSSSVLRGQDVVIEEHAMSEPIRQVLNPIWNSWYFLCLYGETDNVVGRVRTDQEGVLDRYILSKLAVVVEDVTDALSSYDLADATQSITGFLDALTNWYVRRSRDRFWRPITGDETEDRDKRDAYDTLHTVLETLCRLCAPLLPLLTERVYRGLTGAPSVHLTDWPNVGDLHRDDELVAAMDLVRSVCSAGHSIRKAQGLRARLPLALLTYAGTDAESLAPFRDLISDELNVKEVLLVSDASSLSTTKLSLIPAVLGPRVGESMQMVMAAYRKGDFIIDIDGSVTVGGTKLLDGEFELRIAPSDEATSRILEAHGSVVHLDTDMTTELDQEGIARDIVRIVQKARKDAGFNVADRIILEIEGEPELDGIIRIWDDEIAAQTLATELHYRHHEGTGRYRLANGTAINITVTRV
jgi:isoleucyl-tRNA synthetase